MVANPTVRLILQPLRKFIDAADRVDAWREKNKGKIAEATSDPKNHRKSATAKEICVDGSLSIQDRFGLTTEIEMVAADLEAADYSKEANQFRAVIRKVDENGGDDQIPVDAFRRLLDIHCPGPHTNDEAIYLGGGRVKIGDASVKLTRRCHVKSLEYLVKHRNADTKDLASCTSNPSIMMKQLFEIKGGLLAPFLTLPGKERKGEGYSTTIIDGRPKN